MSIIVAVVIVVVVLLALCLAVYFCRNTSKAKVFSDFFFPPLALPLKSDVFLSYDCGPDSQGRSNLKRISLINKELKSRGFVTWFDEKKTRNDRNKVANGIGGTRCALVFITEQYRDNANRADNDNNCNYEFNYALESLGSSKMIPVVVEPALLDPLTWNGNLGVLGSHGKVDVTDDSDSMIVAACDILELQIMDIIGTKVNDGNFDNIGLNAAEAAVGVSVAVQSPADVEANVVPSETFDAEGMEPRRESMLLASDVTEI